MDPDVRELHAAYERLIAAAARARLVSPTGQTPAEQGVQLAAVDTVPADDIARVVSLLYRCVYGRRGSEVEINDGIALCQRTLAGLPDSPEDARPRRSGWWSHLLNLLEQMVSVLEAWMPQVLIGALVIAFAWILINTGGGGASLGGASLGGSATAWQTAYSAEAHIAGQHDTSWLRPVSQPTQISLSINPVLDIDSMEPARTPTLDYTTGTDGTFRNADDPFEPPLGWTHRLHVFDRVTADDEYRTPPGAPTRPAVGTADTARVVYTVDVTVNLRADRAVPIPTPAPDALVVRFTCSPDVPVQFAKDAADGLFVIGRRSARVRMRYQVATWIDYSFAPLPATPFVPVIPELPENLRDDAATVIDAIGELPQPTYEATVRRLHQYFAGFSVAPIKTGDRRSSRYLTIALSRKGVCRHRARAFFVTANAVGVRTRLVENRTHSFCEVQLPGGDWRRLEFRLGDSEGPPAAPGATRLAGVRTPGDRHALVSALIVPPALAIVLLLLVSWRRAEVGAHQLDETAPRERHADRDSGSPRECVSAIAATVRAATSGVDLTAEERERLSRIEKVAGERSHAPERAELQDVFWDAYYLLDRRDGGRS